MCTAAEGNPLYLEQLTASLEDQGLLADGTWLGAEAATVAQQGTIEAGEERICDTAHGSGSPRVGSSDGDDADAGSGEEPDLGRGVALHPSSDRHVDRLAVHLVKSAGGDVASDPGERDRRPEERQLHLASVGVAGDDRHLLGPP